MRLTQAGIDYVCQNFGDTNLCCVASGLSWFYTREGTDYPETGGTAQIVSRLASGLVDSLTMTTPARGTFTKSDLDAANTESVTLTDAQEITNHDEPTEDQWCYTVTIGSISFTSSPSGVRIYLDGVDQGVTPITLTGVSAGTHLYKLSLSGYEDCLGNAHVTAGETATVHCDMIPITGAGNLSGRVTDSETDEAVEGAVVEIAGKQDAVDASGYYFIPNIPTGTHSISISKSGYETYTDTISIAEGDNYYDVVLVITAAIGDIKGRVIDRHDTPIVNAKAVITETGQFDYTDDEGYFVITSVPVGTRTIEITKENHDTEYIVVDIAEGFNELVEPVTLYAGWMPKVSPAMIAGVVALAGLLGTIILKR